MFHIRLKHITTQKTLWINTVLGVPSFKTNDNDEKREDD
jgi:hypothetical protein